MRFPRVPDWLIYTAVILALLMIASTRRERVYNPPAPPPPAEAEGALLGPITPFDPTVMIEAPPNFQPSMGTAFAISADGRWLTARHVVEGCPRPALMIGGGRAVAVDVRLAPRADVALLITEGGPAAMPLAVEAPLRQGQRAFHPGYPQGAPGEVTSRLLGRETLRISGRGARDEPVLAWAEVGRTDGLAGTLAGLSGAPAVDRQGRVIGVTIAEAPRRGRIYTTAPDTLAPVLRGAVPNGEQAMGEPVTIDNYYRVADRLRRDLRVAQVVCLD